MKQKINVEKAMMYLLLKQFEYETKYNMTVYDDDYTAVTFEEWLLENGITD